MLICLFAYQLICLSTMYWANFLHIYQPPNQMPDILDRIANESYRKIIQGLKENPKAKITLNINAGLTELLYKLGYKDIIYNLKTLAERGQIEFTESAKYHAFLPMIPKSEIERQIKLNNETNKKYFGKIYKPVGFFPPEMAYHPKIAEVAADLGYKWLIVDEIAYNGKVGQVSFEKVYTVKGTKNLKIFFREQKTSNLIIGAVIRSKKSLLEVLEKELHKNRYLLTAMDGETLGHHRPGLESLFFDICRSRVFEKITISEIEKYFPEAEAIEPISSTWSSSEQDLKNNTPYIQWAHPDNPIHNWQWKFTNLALRLVQEMDKKKPDYAVARKKLDQALHSCQYWWASAKPWWSLEMVESGAWKLLDVINSIKNLPEKTRNYAQDLYEKIIFKTFEWQRTGYVRKLSGGGTIWKKVPFKERTPPEWFNVIILEFSKEMQRAAQKQEYEKAIKWRDAIYKLKSGADVFDVIHVVDELNTLCRMPTVKTFAERKRFPGFAKKHFLPTENK